MVSKLLQRLDAKSVMEKTKQAGWEYWLRFSSIDLNFFLIFIHLQIILE